jgi:hypothetical protein
MELATNRKADSLNKIEYTAENQILKFGFMPIQNVPNVLAVLARPDNLLRTSYSGERLMS